MSHAGAALTYHLPPLAERRPSTCASPEPDMAGLELCCLVRFHIPNDEAHYLQFTSWIADSYNLNTWMIVSSMVGLGLSWWQAWICVWLGYGCIAPFIVLNARPGAVHHITFPVVARTSFGIWGSLWCTLNRGFMACVWYGVQVC